MRIVKIVSTFQFMCDSSTTGHIEFSLSETNDPYSVCLMFCTVVKLLSIFVGDIFKLRLTQMTEIQLLNTSIVSLINRFPLPALCTF